MPLTVRKRKGEHFNALLYRFNKRVRQSGVIAEVRKRRYFSRPKNKVRRRKSALYRVQKAEEMKQLKRYGNFTRGRGR